MERATLRVVHVSRFYHPHVGGTENHIADLAAFLTDYGIESAVLATRRKVDKAGPRPHVPVYRIPVVGPDRLPIPYSGLKAMNDVLRSADIIHVHDLRFALELVTALGTFRRVPMVLSSHGLIFHTPRLQTVKKLMWRSYYRALLNRFTMIVCVSEADADACRRAGIVRNVRVVLNPVTTKPFESVRPLSQGNGALLYFGRLAPNKGVERLAAVLMAAPAGWTLTIAGTGDAEYVRQLERTFAQLGPRCRFLGPIAEARLPSLITSHDCVLLPSRGEGFGLTLVEAMATGVPVVGSDIPPYREIAADSSVALVDFDQPISCVQNIQNAMTNWDAASTRKRAAGFSWQLRGHDFVRLYRSLVQ